MSSSGGFYDYLMVVGIILRRNFKLNDLMCSWYFFYLVAEILAKTTGVVLIISLQLLWFYTLQILAKYSTLMIVNIKQTK